MARLLARRGQLQRQGVNAFAQFIGDDAVNEALAGDAVFAKEGRRFDCHICGVQLVGSSN